MAKKKGQGTNKKVKREMEAKQAKTKKVIVISAVVVVFLAIAALFVYDAVMKSGTEFYSDGHQSVRLFSDGTFTAELYHGVRYSGTYEKIGQGDDFSIAYTSGDVTVTGEVTGRLLHIPEEWQDDHGHGTVLTKQ